MDHSHYHCDDDSTLPATEELPPPIPVPVVHHRMNSHVDENHYDIDDDDDHQYVTHGIKNITKVTMKDKSNIINNVDKNQDIVENISEIPDHIGLSLESINSFDIVRNKKYYIYNYIKQAGFNMPDTGISSRLPYVLLFYCVAFICM